MASSRLPRPFNRLEKGLKYDTLDLIFSYAGRQAAAAFQIAINGHDKRHIFYEPFHHWDWYEQRDPDNFKPLRLQKRRVLWDEEKGFRADGKPWICYPSAQERWQAFKSQVNDSNRFFVKSIAAGDFMSTEDLIWIARELPALERLDLSLYHKTKEETFEDSDEDSSSPDYPDWEEVASALSSIHDAGNNIFSRLRSIAVAPWGVHNSNHPMFALVPLCTQLETLCIREPSTYWKRIHQDAIQDWSETDVHEEVCGLLLGIIDYAPSSVTTIELLYQLDFLPYFMEKLHETKPTIKRVAIKLAEWIYAYPLRRWAEWTPNSHKHLLPTVDIDINVERFAYGIAAVAERIAHLPVDKNSPLRSFRSDEDNTEAADRLRDKRNEECEDMNWKSTISFYEKGNGGSWHFTENPKPAEHSNGSFAGRCPLDSSTGHADTRQILERSKVNTLLRMFQMLYDSAQASEIALVSLGPKENTGPIDPLALIQDTSHGFGCGPSYADVTSESDLTEVYDWLHVVFDWRPIFDWDWFMVPRDPQTMCDTVPGAYKMMVYAGLKEDADWLETSCLRRLENQLRSLKQVGVPIHLLIGKRDEASSSCYWGWPYDDKAWKAWLARPFDANLHSIAGLVDKLSIFYDLRNPLDRRRLEDIDFLDEYKRPDAVCPAVPCPWAKTGEQWPMYEDCPFMRQRKPLAEPDVGNTKRNSSQKMANKQSLKEKTAADGRYAGLAPFIYTAPPTGQCADDHPSDDTDVEDNSQLTTGAPLHRLARKAAFLRESVGWQRFWGIYALKFTSLTELRVRMPRCFDQAASWRLAKLLDARVGWQMRAYTDERERLQTNEDLLRHLPEGESKPYPFEHKIESKKWPAGRFIRRTWVWFPSKTTFDPLPAGQNVKSRSIFKAEPTPSWGKRVFTDVDWEETFIEDEREYKKACDNAAATHEKERESEERLKEELDEQPERLENRRRLKGLYHLGLRQYAQRAWEAALQRRIDTLKDDDDDDKRWPDTEDVEDLEPTELDKQISFLKSWQQRDAPIFGEPSRDVLEDTDEIRAEMNWNTMDADWEDKQFEIYEQLAAAGNPGPEQDNAGIPVPITPVTPTTPGFGKRKSTGTGEDLTSPVAKMPRIAEEVDLEIIPGTVTTLDTSSTGTTTVIAEAIPTQAPSISPSRPRDTTSPTKTTTVKSAKSSERRPPTPRPPKTSSSSRSKTKSAPSLPAVAEEAQEAPAPIPIPDDEAPTSTQGPSATEAQVEEVSAPTKSASSAAGGRKRKATPALASTEDADKAAAAPAEPPAEPPAKKAKRSTKAKSATPAPEPSSVSTPAPPKSTRKRKTSPTPSAAEPSSAPASKKARTTKKKEPTPAPIPEEHIDELAPTDAEDGKGSKTKSKKAAKKRDSTAAYVPSPEAEADADAVGPEDEVVPEKPTSTARGKASARGRGGRAGSAARSTRGASTAPEPPTFTGPATEAAPTAAPSAPKQPKPTRGKASKKATTAVPTEEDTLESIVEEAKLEAQESMSKAKTAGKKKEKGAEPGPEPEPKEKKTRVSRVKKEAQPIKSPVAGRTRSRKPL